VVWDAPIGAVNSCHRYGQWHCFTQRMSVAGTEPLRGNVRDQGEFWRVSGLPAGSVELPYVPTD
jgi:hypothetical protein